VAWNNFFIFAVWSEGEFQMSPMFRGVATAPSNLPLNQEFRLTARRLPPRPDCGGGGGSFECNGEMQSA
jgi:hypothetical protein